MKIDYPTSTKKLIDYVVEKKLWYNITWNHEARSCADAANKRNRLGNIGIPLCDELKSNIGYYFSNSEKKYLLIHCRGNQMIDDAKVNYLLDSEFIRLPQDELSNLFNCEYGLVNPFYFSSEFPEINQLFDNSVLENFFPPYTLMTNAGDKNWGIEFKPIELLNILQSKLVGDIIIKSIRAKLGDDFLGDLSFPTVIVKSMPEMG